MRFYAEYKYYLLSKAKAAAKTSRFATAPFVFRKYAFCILFLRYIADYSPRHLAGLSQRSSDKKEKYEVAAITAVK